MSESYVRTWEAPFIAAFSVIASMLICFWLVTAICPSIARSEILKSLKERNAVEWYLDEKNERQWRIICPQCNHKKSDAKK